MSRRDRGRPFRDYRYDDFDSKDSSKMFTIVLIILLILLPILVWILTSRNRKPQKQSCDEDDECDDGLKCIDGTCDKVSTKCKKLSKPTGILHVESPAGESINLTIVWSPVPNADAYLIFMGDNAGFDPYTGSMYSTVSKETNRLFEDIPYDTQIHVKIIAVSNICGLSKPSYPYSFTTREQT